MKKKLVTTLSLLLIGLSAFASIPAYASEKVKTTDSSATSIKIQSLTSSPAGNISVASTAPELLSYTVTKYRANKDSLPWRFYYSTKALGYNYGGYVFLNDILHENNDGTCTAEYKGTLTRGSEIK